MSWWLQNFILWVPILGEGFRTSLLWFLSINWLASTDLGKESYQEILQPDYEGVNMVVTLALGVLRNCLCIFAHSNSFNDVWLMKEYGNKESWTKLISVPPYVGDLGFCFYIR